MLILCAAFVVKTPNSIEDPNAMMNKSFNSPRRLLAMLVFALLIAGGGSVFAQQFNPDLFKSLHWRSIGPFRGGRTRAVAGVPSQPNVFYIAQVNGGVFK